MKILDLFAGIGGFSLAAHWMGWETVGFVEWDKYNQKVLAKNFPNTPIHGDITTYHGTLHEADIITGGFPCQPFSTAGKREGTNDSRYLWPEMLRVIREVQPTYVIGENVAGIYSMDNGSVFEQVCTDMENEGYAVQPFRIPACATGAPHRRDRWWFCAAKNSDISGDGRVQTIANANQSNDRRHNNNRRLQGPSKTNERKEQREERDHTKRKRGGAGFGNGIKTAANANQKRLEGRLRPGNDTPKTEGRGASAHRGVRHQHSVPGEGDWYEVAARLCRMDDGLPAWVDRHRTNRLKTLGNTIQPQVAYELLRSITAGHFNRTITTA
jgi:DNA (cytosine-5)-methyltransferase 1